MGNNRFAIAQVEGKKILIYGASRMGLIALDILSPLCEIVAFCDSDPGKRGSMIQGIPVVSPQDLRSGFPETTIVVASSFYPEIISSLKQLNVANQMLVFHYANVQDQSRSSRSMLVPPMDPDTIRDVRMENVSTLSEKLSLRQPMPVKKERNLLWFTYFYPPLGGGGVQRSTKFIKYLERDNWNPFVVCAGQSFWFERVDPTLQVDVPEGILIQRIDQRKPLCEQFDSRDIERILALLQVVLGSDKHVRRLLETVLNTRGLKRELLMLPDSCIHWVCDVLEFLPQWLHSHAPAAVITSSSPYSIHLLGWIVRECYGIPWIADFRDDWTGHAYYADDYHGDRMVSDIQNLLEQSVVHKADQVITVSEPIRQNLIRRHALADAKVMTITNGYDEEDFSLLNHDSDSRNERFTIQFLGSMYRCIRPDQLIHVLNQMIESDVISRNEIVLKITGSIEAEILDSIRLQDVNQIVETEPYLSHGECLEQGIHADLLFLITGGQPCHQGVYTGKIFEYLRLEKPILALTPPGSVVDELLKETCCGRNYHPDDLDGIQEYLTEMILRWSNKTSILVSPDRHRIRVFSRQNTARKLGGVINSITIKN